MKKYLIIATVVFRRKNGAVATKAIPHFYIYSKSECDAKHVAKLVIRAANTENRRYYVSAIETE